MRIQLFATLKEKAGASHLELALPAGGLSVRALRDLAMARHPKLAALIDVAVVAVNAEFAFDEDPVREADEVALFPPVSGGSETPPQPTHLAITRDPISLDALQRFVTTDWDGSAVLFVGTVRHISKDGLTDGLAYEAYQAMAERKLAQVADELRAKFPGVHGLAMVQRIGPMVIGEVTVAVACSSAHRGDGAFEAARFGIDRIKQIVPVWKRETRPDGSSWIEGDYVPQRGD
jgi:MoaE-MoaD fusion protein